MNIFMTILEGFHDSFSSVANEARSSFRRLGLAHLTEELMNVVVNGVDNWLKIVAALVDCDVALRADENCIALVEIFGEGSVEGNETGHTVHFHDIIGVDFMTLHVGRYIYYGENNKQFINTELAALWSKCSKNRIYFLITTCPYITATSVRTMLYILYCLPADIFSGTDRDIQLEVCTRNSTVSVLRRVVQ